MDHEVCVVADMTDLDRDSRLPMSALMTWAQKCRVALYHSKTNSLLALLREQVGTLMVKSQTFAFVEGDSAGDQIPLNTVVLVKQTLGGLGKSSFAMELVFSHNDQVFARGVVVMVCVKQGKAVEIPTDVRDSMVLSNGTVPPITKVVPPPPHVWKDTVNMQVIMRSSDEDTNKHVKHVRYCHFVEDCVQKIPHAAPQVEAITVTYLKECHRGEVCSLVLHYNEQAGRFEMLNSQGQKVCEATVHFRLK